MRGVDDWWEFAACARIDPELWFPQAYDSSAAQRAKAVCRTCPVLAECLADEPDVEQQHGIRAGLTSRRRRRNRREAKAS